MINIPKDIEKRVRHMQVLYGQWLADPTFHRMEVIPAGILTGNLQYLYEYMDALTGKEDSLPVSVAWLLEQIIGAMYEYNKRIFNSIDESST